ncbi:MAG: SDR family oxidoreductase [Planctomycetota bacterium]
MIFKEGFGSLKDKIAIVTGGASGIGRATCLSFVKHGVKVTLVDIDQEQINFAISEITQEQSGLDESLLGLAADVRSEEDMKEMVLCTLNRFGQVDILVHSAGILRSKGSGPKFMYQMSVDEWVAVIETNLKGTFLSNRAVLEAMIKQRSGQIFNLSSTSGLQGRPFDSAYCASKFGVIGLTEALAEEVRQFGIKVHSVMPDAVNTPIWDQNGPVKAPKDSLPPERVADFITYLAALPEDTLLDHLVILPFKTRRRKKAKTDRN